MDEKKDVLKRIVEIDSEFMINKKKFLSSLSFINLLAGVLFAFIMNVFEYGTILVIDPVYLFSGFLFGFLFYIAMYFIFKNMLKMPSQLSIDGIVKIRSKSFGLMMVFNSYKEIMVLYKKMYDIKKDNQNNVY